MTVISRKIFIVIIYYIYKKRSFSDLKIIFCMCHKCAYVTTIYSRLLCYTQYFNLYMLSQIAKLNFISWEIQILAENYTNLFFFSSFSVSIDEK